MKVKSAFSRERTFMDEIMMICSQALEAEGYEVKGYSETYQKFIVETNGGDITVDFRD